MSSTPVNSPDPPVSSPAAAALAGGAGRSSEGSPANSPALQAMRQRFSMSTSLASGLARRLLAGAREKELATLNYRPPDPNTKRAVFYRQLRNHRLAITPKLNLISLNESDPTGKSKDSTFEIVLWSLPAEEDVHTSGIEVLSEIYHSRNATLSAMDMMRLSQHALMRMFYRLKTDDETRVLHELRCGAMAVRRHIMALRYLGQEAQVLVPTPSGALILEINKERRSMAPLSANTWISNELIAQRPRQRHAMDAARQCQGFVLDHPSFYTVLSPERVRAVVKTTGAQGAYWGGISPEQINRMVDSTLPEHTRLPAGWRFTDWLEHKQALSHRQALTGSDPNGCAGGSDDHADADVHKVQAAAAMTGFVYAQRMR